MIIKNNAFKKLLTKKILKKIIVNKTFKKFINEKKARKKKKKSLIKHILITIKRFYK